MRHLIIDDWRIAWRFWSLRLNALGTLFFAALYAFPDAMFALWHAFSDELGFYWPRRYITIVGVAFYIAGAAARLIKQRKVERARAELETRQPAAAVPTGS